MVRRIRDSSFADRDRKRRRIVKKVHVHGPLSASVAISLSSPLSTFTPFAPLFLELALVLFAFPVGDTPADFPALASPVVPALVALVALATLPGFPRFSV